MNNYMGLSSSKLGQMTFGPTVFSILGSWMSFMCVVGVFHHRWLDTLHRICQNHKKYKCLSGQGYRCDTGQRPQRKNVNPRWEKAKSACAWCFWWLSKDDSSLDGERGVYRLPGCWCDEDGKDIRNCI